VQHLGFGQAADRRVQVAQESLRVAVNLLALRVAERLLLLLGCPRAEVRPARLGRREVRLADLGEFGVEGNDV